MGDVGTLETPSQSTSLMLLSAPTLNGLGHGPYLAPISPAPNMSWRRSTGQTPPPACDVDPMVLHAILSSSPEPMDFARRVAGDRALVRDKLSSPSSSGASVGPGTEGRSEGDAHLAHRDSLSMPRPRSPHTRPGTHTSVHSMSASIPTTPAFRAHRPALSHSGRLSGRRLGSSAPELGSAVGNVRSNASASLQRSRPQWGQEFAMLIVGQSADR